MTHTPTLSSRVRGSLFGVAIGDCLGGAGKFQARGTFPLITELIPNINFPVPAGSFTDETSMTLCLTQSLVDCQGFDAHDQVKKYLTWRYEGYWSSKPNLGCFDIKEEMSLVLQIWRDHFRQYGGYQQPRSEAARMVTEEGQKVIDLLFNRESACGNGSLMYVIPIALAYHAAGMETAAVYAQEASQITHPHPRCREACALYVQVAVKAIEGCDKAALAQVMAAEAATFTDEKLRDRLSGYKSLDAWQQLSESNINTKGDVLSTLEAALWAFFTTDTFEGGAIRAVNLGHDADTVGAVYGGLAGAFYGYDAIPSRWLDGIKLRNMLRLISEGMEALEGRADESN